MKRWVLVIGGLGLLVWAASGATSRAQEVRSLTQGPRIWAVVVGVGDHDDPTIPDSLAAGPDAAKVVSWLLRSGGWSRDHLLHLGDLGSRQPGTVENPRNTILPTRENLDWAFQKWLPSRFHPGDLVVFFFAGRAGAAVPTSGAGPEYYLLPSDAKRSKLAATGWSLERALDRLMLDTQGKGQVVCLLATAIGVRSPGMKAPDRAGVTTLGGRDWLGRLTRWPGVTAWLARDRPPEDPEQDEPSTRFTRTLLKELGSPSRRVNLASCLEAMQRDLVLRQDAFQTMGAVNPRLTLWPDVFGEPVPVHRPEMTLQVGHADKVTGLVISADGQRAVSASMDSTVRVWSLKNRTLERVLTGHEVGATAIGLSGDGQWLVSGGGRPSNAILVHDLKHDFRQVVQVQDQRHGRAVVQVAMLPDGQHFVSVDLDARSYIWDLKATPPELRPWLDKPDAKVNCRLVASGGDADRGVVAALGDDRAVRVFNASGANEVVLREWADQPTSLAVDPGGLWLALGFKDGRIVVRDLASGRATEARVGVDNPIARLVFSAKGLLAVGHGRGLSVFPITDGRIAQEPGGKTLTDQVPGEIAFSPDGTHLAASTPRDVNGLRIWHVGDDEPRLLAGDEQAGASALAFTGDGRILLAGGFRGGIEARPLEGLRADPAWSMPANRAKVLHLAASPSRRFLLMINDLGLAQVWDLKERSCRRLPGSWTSGAFAAQDDRLVLTETPGPTQPGRLVSVGLVGGKVTFDPSFFKRAGAGIDGDVAFVGLVLSPDGSRVAASANPAQDPLVYVWETMTGLLTHRIGQPGLKDPVRSLSFSSDARYLLSAGDSPEASLWDLGAGKPEPAAPIVTFRDPVARHMSACLIRPGDSHQVVTGHRNGLVRLWTWRERQATPVGPPIDLVEGLFAGEVKALAFATDGKDHYLAAAGDGTSLWLARMAEPRPVRINDLGVRPHHFEQVNALAAWPVAPEGTGPSTPTLISGSDDTMVKLWDIKDRALSLRATFAASGGQHDADAPAGPDAAAMELDWVVFTPDGHFDASAKGRDLIRFRLNDQARALEQFDESKLNTFDLGASLLTGKPFEGVVKLAEPPPIKIEPPAPVAPDRPDTRVTITLGSADLKDVRLYHNNVPIGSGLEARRESDETPSSPGRISVPVRLVKGSNSFYAMATATGREGSWDSRSDEVEIAYDGPSDPGKLHIIALGVGDYQTRKLKFADRDAERISEVLHERGLDLAGKAPGIRIVRKNGDVTTEGVTKAFGELARAVKGRPQDTVVVFLAGHTGVFESLQFCLLLPSYRFPAGAPLVASARDAVVTRDAVGAAVPPRAGDVMPYAVIEANLMRLDALNRLVIVDACQAEAIFDDAQVREIRKWMEVNSRKARNSYLMAARRGEPALEVEGLRHGLFTYTLLRGMGGGINRQDEPSMITDLALRDNADFNGDGIITTGELDDYARSTLPMLAQLFPTLMTRSRDDEARQRPDLPAIREAELTQDLRMQSVSASFPLVPLPVAR